MSQFDFQLLDPGFQLTDGITKSFDRVICDGSHCRLEEHRGGLTKAEENPASWRTVDRQVCRHCAGSEGRRADVGGQRESSQGSAPLVRNFCLVIKFPLGHQPPLGAKLRVPKCSYRTSVFFTMLFNVSIEQAYSVLPSLHQEGMHMTFPENLVPRPSIPQSQAHQQEAETLSGGHQ